LEFDIIT